MSHITLEHGAGGKLSHELVRSIFLRSYGSPLLRRGADKAVVSIGGKRIAFTTDSFVMSPMVVPGCSLGTLCVTGTINDILTCGARPLFMSVSFIVEEGFSTDRLLALSKDIARAARLSRVAVVTGDTKVVERHKADGAYITASGIGEVIEGVDVSGSNAKLGDHVIVTGDIGNHGVAAMLARGEFSITAKTRSDCRSLGDLVLPVLQKFKKGVHALRDPTRGGISTTLNEIAVESKVGIEVDESELPIAKSTKIACELLGIDPLFMANEGIMVLVVDPSSSGRVAELLRGRRFGHRSALIGRVVKNHRGKVKMRTIIGGERYLEMLRGVSLPRIC